MQTLIDCLGGRVRDHTFKCTKQESSYRDRDQSEASSGFSSGSDSDIDQYTFLPPPPNLEPLGLTAEDLANMPTQEYDSGSNNEETGTDDDEKGGNQDSDARLGSGNEITVGIGACFVHGPMNNPVSLMCHQVRQTLLDKWMRYLKTIKR